MPAMPVLSLPHLDYVTTVAIGLPADWGLYIILLPAHTQ